MSVRGNNIIKIINKLIDLELTQRSKILLELKVNWFVFINLINLILISLTKIYVKWGGVLVSKSKVYFTKDITPEAHWQTIKDHGFSDISPCDIMDEEWEIALKVEGGKHLKENYVGAHIKNYDSMLMLSHFKGHAMGGLGSREYEIVNLD